ncbi:hypothetical protein [Hymenobacter sp. GOD-10R]|uniref:hypothetical protein n=1 Tax=Hymenobacter sp. GOD-10R TaxID=3093922 RepID=UPI002D76B34F|nr:hypothetical protein [Hymenobacter sp. GOD-10R]WRQ29367.1 hypothetical protein SD425_03700 [Hymenobacter sp. GOD-10R]
MLSTVTQPRFEYVGSSTFTSAQPVRLFEDRLLATLLGAEITKCGMSPQIKIVYDAEPSPVMLAAHKFYGFRRHPQQNTFTASYNYTAVACAILLASQNNFASAQYTDVRAESIAKSLFGTDYLVHNFNCVMNKLGAKLAPSAN